MNKLITIISIMAALFVTWEAREAIYSTMLWFSNRDAVTIAMKQLGIWGPVTLFALFVFQVFLAFIPGQALMVACGYLYGFWGGFLLSWFSLVAGGELAFVLARRYGRPFAERWVSPQVLSRWNKFAEGQGIIFFSLSLVLPLMPNDAMCYVAGLGKISRPRFGVANMLGRGMACALTSAAGAFGGEISWQAWAVILSIFVLIGIVWQILRFKAH
jgi:uncharacterized membrane protein YdjX (TVP38/TMEM64 family)